MSHRNWYLLLAALSFAGTGFLVWLGFVENAVVGNHDGGTILTGLLFFSFFGGIYFVFHAFPTPPGEVPLPHRFIPSPEVAFEFSAEEGAPGASVAAEVLRAALAAGTGFTVADDPRGWLVLTGTIGPPRWAKNLKGEVVAEKQYARLALRPGADTTAIRPEDVLLVSTETNLTVNASLALAAALGPLRIRARGDDLWLAVAADGLFALLAVRLLRTRPPVVPLTDRPGV